MGDLVMIATVLGFFGACIGYVALCDRVIGPDTVIDDTEQRTADQPTARGVVAAEALVAVDAS